MTFGPLRIEVAPDGRWYTLLEDFETPGGIIHKTFKTDLESTLLKWRAQKPAVWHDYMCRTGKLSDSIPQPVSRWKADWLFRGAVVSEELDRAERHRQIVLIWLHALWAVFKGWLMYLGVSLFSVYLWMTGRRRSRFVDGS